MQNQVVPFQFRTARIRTVAIWWADICR